MGSYGLNNNFATNKDIFTKLLTNDISPTELNSRINTAKQVVENTDPAVAQQLQQYYQA
jgi:nicotinic acid mononucleotide adenylyltransferase